MSIYVGNGMGWHRHSVPLSFIRRGQDSHWNLRAVVRQNVVSLLRRLRRWLESLLAIPRKVA